VHLRNLGLDRAGVYIDITISKRPFFQVYGYGQLASLDYGLTFNYPHVTKSQGNICSIAKNYKCVPHHSIICQAILTIVSFTVTKVYFAERLSMME
jgi:hypothetical protein